MDVRLGVDIVNELDRRFDVERVMLLDKLFSELERRSLALQQREVLVDEALAGTVAAMKTKIKLWRPIPWRFSPREARAKERIPRRRRRPSPYRERTAAVKSAWEAMKSGRREARGLPEDPAANLAVGRYLAFAKGDFVRGCEHLVKGSDATIAAAAQKQLAAQDDNDQLAAIEAWNSLLSSLKSPAEKLQLQRHVLQVCQELMPRLTGLALTPKSMSATCFRSLRKPTNSPPVETVPPKKPRPG